MKTALLLAGGGARGIVQAGMLSMFRDMGWDYDMLFGTSVGALNGALYHADEIDPLIELWQTVKNKDVYNWAPWKLFTPDACFYDTAPLRRNIANRVKFDQIRANHRPFYVSSTSLKTWNPVLSDITHYAKDSDMLDTLMMSSAAPIAFPPVNGSVDGGVINNFNIATAVEAGCDRLILMSPTPADPRSINNVFDVMEFMLSAPEFGYLGREIYFTQRLNSVPGFRKIELIIIQPTRKLGLGLLDFDMNHKDRKLLIGYGREIAQLALRGIKP